MPGELSKRTLQGIKRMLNHDYLAEKDRKKQKRREKAARHKDERHKSRQQFIEELVENELELEGDEQDE